MVEKKDEKLPATQSGEKVSNKKKDDSDDLSLEDKKLKQDIEDLLQTVLTPITTIQNKKEYDDLQKSAISQILQIIRNSTSTMTAIPKPLKFLRAHYGALEVFFNNEELLSKDSPNKAYISDILSVLSMTLGSDDRLVLKYNLLGSKSDVAMCGYEYIRCLAGEISREYDARLQVASESEGKVDTTDFDILIEPIVSYLFEHGGEIEAVDLLLEIGKLNLAAEYVHVDNVVRVGKYVLACAKFCNLSEQTHALLFVFDCFIKTKYLPYALLVSLQVCGDTRDEWIVKVFEALDEIPEVAQDIDVNNNTTVGTHTAHVASYERYALKQQLCYMLAAVHHFPTALEDSLDEACLNILGNYNSSRLFRQLCKDLDSLEPKSPSDVFKEHLQDGVSRRIPRASSTGGPRVDSALQNQSWSFVNALTNVGSGKETLLLQNCDWLYRNKEAGIICAAASIGLVHLWDVDEGFAAADVYSFAKEDTIQAGATLASGLLATGVTSELNAAYALLSEHIEGNENDNIRIASVLGLGICYMGTKREDIKDTLLGLVGDFNIPWNVAAMGILAAGLVYQGSQDEELTATLLMSISGRQEDAGFVCSALRLACVGVALLYYNTNEQPLYLQNNLEDFLAHPINQYLLVTAKSFAFAGTGNVMALQQLMSVLTESVYQEEDDEADEKGTSDVVNNRVEGWLGHIHQAAALIGIAGIATGESIAQQMVGRCFDHILQCADVNLRRIIPFALAFNNISNPDIGVVDSLAKLTHDQDMHVCMNACFSLGLVSAGTNNSRVAQILRSLAGDFSQMPQHLYCVRIAQGMLYMGKGLCTLNPMLFDRMVCNPLSHACLSVLLHCALDIPDVLIKTFPYLLYIITPAIRPRHIITVLGGEAQDPAKQVQLSIRVGQAVDNVGQPGNPRALTGFQTHNTPVLISNNERAEFVTDDYLPMTPVIDGIVVVRKNPNAVSKEI